ncbi:MAG: putative lipid II flippase FtsW [Chloroflexi bacterium]|nr:putative lipid II flippase FtsW [Chloroflexota bacterium]MBV9897795.1 putative lipid II flippase FtsW [Chloroflexota bacterium]
MRPVPLEQLEAKRPDYLLLASTIALLVLGTLMVYSASFVVAHNEFNDDAYFLVRQLMWIAAGLVGLLISARIDYRRWRSLSLPIMFVCIGMLVLVLVPGIGSSSYGAVRWIKLGPVQIQPSEIAKLAMTLYLADWLARRGPIVGELLKGLLPFGIIVGIVAALVAVQPDLGTTAIIIAVAACVFFVGGANLWHITLLGVTGIGAGLVVLAHLSGYQLERIRAFLDPWSDIQGSGWHTAQGLIALGSGGLFGSGLGNGLQKYYWVPNAHTDAIFAIIGEELGLVGCLGVLMLFGVVAWRGFLIAWRGPDAFARLFATGLTCMLTIQTLVNIAVVTNSLPYTGVTLPLVSFGGSSTVISLVAIGLLLNISRQPVAPATEHERVEPELAYAH